MKPLLGRQLEEMVAIERLSADSSSTQPSDLTTSSSSSFFSWLHWCQATRRQNHLISGIWYFDYHHFFCHLLHPPPPPPGYTGARLHAGRTTRLLEFGILVIIIFSAIFFLLLLRLRATLVPGYMGAEPLDFWNLVFRLSSLFLPSSSSSSSVSGLHWCQATWGQNHLISGIWLFRLSSLFLPSSSSSFFWVHWCQATCRQKHSISGIWYFGYHDFFCHLLPPPPSPGELATLVPRNMQAASFGIWCSDYQHFFCHI